MSTQFKRNGNECKSKVRSPLNRLVFSKMTNNDTLTIFLSHGRSILWKEVATYVERELDFEVVVLQEQPNKGRTIIEKLEAVTEDCHFAIIIMKAEDEQIDDTTNANQNAVHEIGFCQGTFGRQNVMVPGKINYISNISALSTKL